MSAAGKAFLSVGAVALFVIVGVIIAIFVNLDQTTDVKEETQETQALLHEVRALAQQVASVGHRVQDCSSQEGECYKQNQEQTKKAIQAILDGIGGQVNPHRLRNEAENLCQAYIFGGNPSVGFSNPADVVVQLYKECVLRESGGTEPPPIPENPYNTTTTTTKPRGAPIR